MTRHWKSMFERSLEWCCVYCCLIDILLIYSEMDWTLHCSVQFAWNYHRRNFVVAVVFSVSLSRSKSQHSLFRFFFRWFQSVPVAVQQTVLLKKTIQVYNFGDFGGLSPKLTGEIPCRSVVIGRSHRHFFRLVSLPWRIRRAICQDACARCRWWQQMRVLL